MRKIWLWLLPELQLLSTQQQGEALQKARETDMDIPELLGVALGLVLVAVATQYALPDGAPLSPLAKALLNFIVALPLMAMAVIPFHVRRLRRGLRMQLQLHRPT